MRNLIAGKTPAPSFRAAGALLFAALAGNCAGAVDETAATLMVDPATYLYHTCQQLVTARIEVSQRRRDLDSLIAQAERDAGGELVSTLVYRSEQAGSAGRARLIEEAWRDRNCDTARLEPLQPQLNPSPAAPPRNRLR